MMYTQDIHLNRERRKTSGVRAEITSYDSPPIFAVLKILIGDDYELTFFCDDADHAREVVEAIWAAAVRPAEKPAEKV